jgi:hypothetical protein
MVGFFFIRIEWHLIFLNAQAQKTKENIEKKFVEEN